MAPAPLPRLFMRSGARLAFIFCIVMCRVQLSRCVMVSFVGPWSCLRDCVGVVDGCQDETGSLS